jgi:hypothetical protein
MSEHMTPVMYVDPSGEIAVLLFLAAVACGSLILSAIVGHYYNREANKKLDSARVNFGEEVNDSEYRFSQEGAEVYLDEMARFAVYNNAAKTSSVMNGLKWIVQFAASFANADIPFSRTLSPGMSTTMDIDLSTDATIIVSSNRFDNLNQVDLQKYYIDRYKYWEEHYND